LKIINKKTQFVQEITFLYNFSDIKKNRIKPSKMAAICHLVVVYKARAILQVTHQITSLSPSEYVPVTSSRKRQYSYCVGTIYDNLSSLSGLHTIVLFCFFLLCVCHSGSPSSFLGRLYSLCLKNHCQLVLHYSCVIC